MTASEWEVTTAWHELLDGLRSIDAAFLEGDRRSRTTRAPQTGTAWR